MVLTQIRVFKEHKCSSKEEGYSCILEDVKESIKDEGYTVAANDSCDFYFLRTVENQH